MLTLLSEPNVLLLDEPTNDVDTDTLAAMEDLLDSWPGTLIVVSHDRYLLERVTDQQYAVLDGRLRHLPGGIDEYLRLAAQRHDAAPPAGHDQSDHVGTTRLTRELRALEDEVATAESRWLDVGAARMRPVRYRPGEALLALYRRRGQVIDAGAGRRGYTLLLGAEANKFVFANADAFSWRATFENLALVDGPTALIVSDGDDHRRRRRRWWPPGCGTDRSRTT